MSQEPESASSMPYMGSAPTPTHSLSEREQALVRLKKKKKKRIPVPQKTAGFGAYLTLFVLVIAVFSPLFNSDTLWPEYDLPERSAYESMEYWTEAWTLQSIRNNDPLTLTSYFLEQASPLSPVIVHRAINLLLHLIAAILLLKTLEALKARAAFAATLTFALHPVVIQTIFWSGYRTEIVALILILSALYCGTRNRGAAGYFATLMFSALACLIHPAAMTIPIILSLIILYQEKKVHLHSFNRALPLLCISIFIGLWALSGNSTHSSESPTAESITFLNQLGQNMFFFMRQAFLPIYVALFHPIETGTGYQVNAEMSLLPFLLFIPFYVLIALNLKKSWSRAALLGLTAYLALAWYGVSGTGSFIDGSLAHEDHRHYIALPAIIALVVCTGGHLAHRFGFSGKSLGILTFSAALFCLAAITGSYTYKIAEPTRMWQSMVEQWPHSWVPKAALIDHVIASESEALNLEEQINLLKSILDEKPELSKQRIQLGRLYVKAGQSTNALRIYKQILRETTPDNAFLEEAAQFYDKAGLAWEASSTRKRIQPEKVTTGTE